MKKTTKERIIVEALTLFSKNGYEAVSVVQIASAVGIKAPSLYKHFKSKQDIFSAIINEMAQRYDEQMKNLLMNGKDPNEDKTMFLTMDIDTLIMTGKTLFQFYLHDEVSSKFRQLLAIEQYHDPALAKLYHEQYFYAPIAYQSSLFAHFIQAGTMKKEKPEIIALHFYAPLFTLLSFADSDASKEETIMNMLEEHVRQFHRLYIL